jgi:trk system potassium uptake protein TrkA
MNVIVVGCGRVGSTLAYRLFQAGHRVAVVDRDSRAFLNLPPDFTGRLHEGDALSQEVLVRAGIREADALAVVTNSDPLNAVVGHVARVEFKTPVVVARNYDPQFRPLFEEFNLQVVSAASVHTVFSAGNGEVEVYEFAVPSEWHGRSLKELTAGVEVLPIAVSRAGRAMLPEAEWVFEEGDLLYVSASFSGISDLRFRLTNSSKVEG